MNKAFATISAKKARCLSNIRCDGFRAGSLNDFQRKNTKFDVSYVAVNPHRPRKDDHADRAGTQDYFEKNKANYTSAFRRKRSNMFSSTPLRSARNSRSAERSACRIRQAVPDKKIAGVIGQEIVLRVPKPEFEARFWQRRLRSCSRLEKGRS